MDRTAPPRLRDFRGNPRLARLLRDGPLPQTSLFAGPQGVGKKTLAWALATRANCEQPQAGDGCGRCRSCIRSGNGAHPDIRFYQPEKAVIRIEAMREMSREARYRPFEGKLRFFILDQADRLSDEAANSILKTLEEPPDTSHFFLISSLPESLLPTIRSRCQTFSFQPLSRREIEDYLQQHGVQEASLRAAFGRGSLGGAVSLDLPRLLAHRDLMLELLSSWIQTASFESLFHRLEKAPLRSEIRNRERAGEMLDQLETLLQDLYFLQVNTPQRLVHLDRLALLEALASKVTLDWIRTFLYHVSQARRDLEHHVNSQFCLETLWLSSDPSPD